MVSVRHSFVVLGALASPVAASIPVGALDVRLNALEERIVKLSHVKAATTPDMYGSACTNDAACGDSILQCALIPQTGMGLCCYLGSSVVEGVCKADMVGITPRHP